jgi:membrane-bound serine protease (ClpP class)
MRRIALFVSILLPLLCVFALASDAAWAQASSPAASPLAASPLAASPAAPTAISVLKVEGAIDRALMSHLNDRLTSAEQQGAIVVLQLNTSGTLNEDGIALAQRVASLRVPVIAWVGPAPAKASGAGLLLMYASSLAAVSPGSQTGPLDPIDLAHPEAQYPGLQQTIQGWLDARGKTTKLERLDEPLSAQAAIDLAIAQVHASSVPELLDTIDGTSVSTPTGPVTLQTRIATDKQEADQRTVSIEFDNLGPVKRVLHAVSSPSMVFFLLVIGLACIAFEITQPGFGFAGFAGVGMLALAAYGLWVVPPAWLWLAVMVGGIGLMTLDVRLRNLGLLTAAGLVAFGMGSFLAWHAMAPAIRISPWLVGGAVIASALYYGFVLTVAIQSRDRIINTQRGLIGLIGEARGKLAPEGPVYVKGAMWRGRAAGDPIAPGTAVRVRGIDGMVLKVEAEPPAAPPGELEPSAM